MQPTEGSLALQQLLLPPFPSSLRPRLQRLLGHLVRGRQLFAEPPRLRSQHLVAPLGALKGPHRAVLLQAEPAPQ